MRRRGERGATAVEYALLAAAVALMALLGVKAMEVAFGAVHAHETCRAGSLNPVEDCPL